MERLYLALAAVSLLQVVSCQTSPIVPDGRDEVPFHGERESAQSIRDGAGLRPGEWVGVRPSREPGLSDPSGLVAYGPVNITCRAEAAAIASSGFGTDADPYVVECIAVDGAGAPSGCSFRWSDPGADYHIRLENVALSGAAGSQLHVDSGGSLTLARSLVTGSGAAGAGIVVARGTLRVRETIFDALANDGIRTVGTEGPVTVLVADCAFTDASGPWGAGAHGVQSTSGSDAVSITVEYCQFSAPSLDMGVRTWRNANYLVRNSRFATRIGIRGGTEEVSGLRVIACVFETRLNAIRGLYFVDWEVAHCEFLDNEAGARLARFDDCRDGRVHHCRFTKTSGEGPGNECLESFDSSAIEFDHNWVTTCTEDAFEHVRPRNGCSVHHCVGDDVALQIVDFFGYHPENGGLVHDIHGDCGDVGVLITDVDNVVVHDIFTDNSRGRWSNVTLEQRDAEPGTRPAGCTIRAPLPHPSRSAEGGPFGVRGTVGPGNTASWWQDGELRFFSS
jgi:hypothetical protein